MIVCFSAFLYLRYSVYGVPLVAVGGAKTLILSTTTSNMHHLQSKASLPLPFVQCSAVQCSAAPRRWGPLSLIYYGDVNDRKLVFMLS